tara:strand:+ start:509 stop:787 length:279 start_codon:yes stop_codon:yes gene_type:complete
MSKALLELMEIKNEIIEKQDKEIVALKEHCDRILYLIKYANTPDKLKQLRELPYLGRNLDDLEDLPEKSWDCACDEICGECVIGSGLDLSKN